MDYEKNLVKEVKRTIRKWPKSVESSFYIEFYLTVSQYALMALYQEEKVLSQARLVASEAKLL